MGLLSAVNISMAQEFEPNSSWAHLSRQHCTSELEVVAVSCSFHTFYLREANHGAGSGAEGEAHQSH